MSNESNNDADRRCLHRLVSGEFYRIKYHGHWEVAMWEDSCEWWLVGRKHPTDPEHIDEIGEHVHRPAKMEDNHE